MSGHDEENLIEKTMRFGTEPTNLRCRRRTTLGLGVSKSCGVYVARAKNVLNLRLLNGKNVIASQSTILKNIRVSSVGDILLQNLRIWVCNYDHHARLDMIFSMDVSCVL